jgi:hypothetical protein
VTLILPGGTLLLSLRLYVSVTSDAQDLLPESNFIRAYKNWWC